MLLATLDRSHYHKYKGGYNGSIIKDRDLQQNVNLFEPIFNWKMFSLILDGIYYTVQEITKIVVMTSPLKKKTCNKN